MEDLYFSSNFTDRSVRSGANAGFQFDFLCQRCHDVWRSPFVAFQSEQASSWIKEAGNLAGSFFRGSSAISRAGDMAEQMAQAGYGKAHDEALAVAIEGAKAHFHRCAHCSHYVCQRCWNEAKGLCLECSPDLQAEVESARNSAETAAAADLARQEGQRLGQAEAAEVIKAPHQLVCPKCNAQTDGAKFCPQCGAPLNVITKCPSCSQVIPAGSKFCPNCGTKTV